eukprot:UN18005
MYLESPGIVLTIQDTNPDMNNLRNSLEIILEEIVEIETEHTTTDQELYKLKSEYNKLKYEMDNFDLGSVKT